jgi:hypothetical protein
MGSPKIGKVNAWGQGIKSQGIISQNPREAGTANDCMLPRLSRRRKSNVHSVEQRRSMQGVRLNGAWGGKRCCTRSRSESDSRNQQRRGARQLFAAVRTAPPRVAPIADSSSARLRELYRSSHGARRRHPGCHGSRSMLRVKGPNLDRHPPQPCILSRLGTTILLSAESG